MYRAGLALAGLAQAPCYHCAEFSRRLAVAILAAVGKARQGLEGLEEIAADEQLVVVERAVVRGAQEGVVRAHRNFLVAAQDGSEYFYSAGGHGGQTGKGPADQARGD